MRNATSQRGGFVIGMIVGLLIGLALALGVALYVTKVPVPFVNKVPQRTPGQDAAEAEKNKNWDPNSPLYGKNPAHPMASASGTVATPDNLPPAEANAPQSIPPTLPPPTTATTTARASAPASTRDPAAILAGALPGSAPQAASKPDRTLAAAAADPFVYYVQAGAYGRTEDAEQQRAKLALMGLQSKLTEREQSGHTVYRVRLGPYDSKDEADAAKTRLDGAGVDAALVRVQRQ